MEVGRFIVWQYETIVNESLLNLLVSECRENGSQCIEKCIKSNCSELKDRRKEKDCYRIFRHFSQSKQFLNHHVSLFFYCKYYFIFITDLFMLK